MSRLAMLDDASYYAVLLLTSCYDQARFDVARFHVLRVRSDTSKTGVEPEHRQRHLCDTVPCSIGNNRLAAVCAHAVLRRFVLLSIVKGCCSACGNRAADRHCAQLRGAGLQAHRSVEAAEDLDLVQIWAGITSAGTSELGDLATDWRCSSWGKGLVWASWFLLPLA